MRVSRMSLVGSVVMGLLASMPVAALAQEELQEAARATLSPEARCRSSDGRYISVEMDWSDPHLPSRMLYDFDIDEHVAIHPDGPALAMQED